MASPVQFTIDPTVPLGSDSLRTGPPTIRATPTALNEIFGLFPATGQQSPLSPIQGILNPGDVSAVRLQLWHDPSTAAADALAASTREYTDLRTPMLVLSGMDGTNYNGMFTLADTSFSWTWVPNAVYILQNTGITNSGSPVISINGTTAKTLVNLDGTPLAVGTFLATGLYVAVYDGTSLRMVGFVGGTLTQPLILAGDPTVAKGAATKEYVDGEVTAPIQTPMASATVSLNHTATDIVPDAAIVIPGDGPYLLFAEYAIAIAYSMSEERQINVQLWVVDDQSNFWACAGNGFSNGQNGGLGGGWIASGAGFSPKTYTAGSTVHLKVQGAFGGDNSSVTAKQVPTWDHGPTFPTGFPESYLRVTLVRSH